MLTTFLTVCSYHHIILISIACWEGSLICLHQCSTESPAIFSILQRLFHSNSISDLRSLAEKKGVTAEEFKDFLQYAGAFYGNSNIRDMDLIPIRKSRKLLEFW